MPHRLEEALRAWREAERRLEQARPGSPEEAQAAAEMRRARAEYNRLAREQGDVRDEPRAPPD